MNELQEETEKLINQTTAMIQKMSTKSGDADNSGLPDIIPELDTAIVKYKPFFVQKTINNGNQLVIIMQQRVKNYLNSKKPNFDNLYIKMFQHYNQVIDDMTIDIVNTGTSFKMNLENNDVNTQELIKEAEHKFERRYIEMTENNKIELENLEKKVNENIDSLQVKLKDEEKRLISHYEKLISSKNESLEMTEIAFEKAKKDVDDSSQAIKKDIEDIMLKNNETLKHHQEQVIAALKDDKMKINELKIQIKKIQNKIDLISPGLNENWEKKKDELIAKFKEGDFEYGEKKKDLLMQIETIQKEIEAQDARINDIHNEHSKDESSIMEDYEKQLKEVLDSRPSKIENSTLEAKAELKEKNRKLKECLNQLNEQFENDKLSLENKKKNKGELHKKKLKEIQNSQKEFIQQANEEINNIQKEIKNTKIQWKEEKRVIEEGYKQDLIDVKEKTENEQKYYQVKLTSLKKELKRVIKENKDYIAQTSLSNEERLSIESKNRETEAHYSSALHIEMNSKLDERIQAKINEIKEKHELERQKIIEEINAAKKHEKELQDKYKGVSESLEVMNRNPSSIVGEYTSSKFIDEQTDKWRKIFLANCKNLKQEEAIALKELDSSKQEFQEAVHKTLKLRDKLLSTSQIYNEAYEKAKGKSEEELKEYKDAILLKEKEIADLEKEYEDNEKELRKRTRQLEQAEDKLLMLRTKLTDEKNLIREKIENDYKPLIEEEQKKNEIMTNNFNALKQELEMEVEILQNDLGVVKASNQAMAEGLQNETIEMVKKVKNQINIGLKEKENDALKETRESEDKMRDEIDAQLAKFKEEEDILYNEYATKIEEQQAGYKEEISVLNNKCTEMISENCNKKDEVIKLESKQCTICPVLKKSIKSFEKQLIQLQEEAQKLALQDNNNNETYHKVHTLKKKSLPPLVQYGV